MSVQIKKNGVWKTVAGANGTMSSNNSWCYPISYFVLSY